jgi:hypothetical protein
MEIKLLFKKPPVSNERDSPFYVDMVPYCDIMLNIKIFLEGAAINAEKVEQLIALLEKTCSLAEVSFVLKAHGVHFSGGSWKQMRDQRIDPALKSGDLPVSALLKLLRDSEEFGNQHVFLYQTSKVNAANLVNSEDLANRLKTIGRTDLLKEPNLLAKPKTRGWADARIENGPNGPTLILKAVEAKAYYKLKEAYDENDGEYRVKRYCRVVLRAVDVLRVHSDGFTELRLQSQECVSDYSEDVSHAWNFFAPLVSRFQFKDLSISKAQQRLWANRAMLKEQLRYSDSRLRDSKGVVLTAATGAVQDSLFDNEHAAKSIDAFWDGDTTCDKSNMWWLKSEHPSGIPSRHIHIRIAGAVNEFAIPGQCNREDYEYVLAQIRKANH